MVPSTRGRSHRTRRLAEFIVGVSGWTWSLRWSLLGDVRALQGQIKQGLVVWFR